MWVHSHSLYCDFTNKSMTNIILSLLFLCNYGNGKYKLGMHCLYIILHTGIIGLIIFLKPGLEPSPTPFKPGRWAGLGLDGLWVWPSTSLFTAIRIHHITNGTHYQHTI